MRLFSRRNRPTIKPGIWENLPVPKPNEIFAAPVDNRLWHPKLALRTSRSRTPDWFRDLPHGELSLKRCYGVADFLRTGYVLPLWATLDVRLPINKLNTRWDARFDGIASELFRVESLSEKDKQYFFSQHALSNNQFGSQQTGGDCPVAHKKPRESSYLKLPTPWVVRTAPGWSSLFLPVLWEPNDNYEVLGAVVHTDYYPNGNLVMNILTNQPFRIEEGTVMQHIIPFKRDASILDTEVLRGDESAHKLLHNTGFGAVFTGKEDMHGGYKREQKRLDNETN
jgi:hypothetical protein